MKKFAFLVALFISDLAYSYQIQLIDAFSGFVLSKMKLSIIRENTIRCASAPCPSNETKHDLSSDQNGFINIGPIHSKENLSGDFLIVVSQYHPFRIPKVLNSKVLNKIELIPVKIDSSFRQITFMSKINNEPLTDLEVTFSREEKECSSRNCPSVFFKAKTNKLGHVFYKFLIAFPNGLAEMNPIWLHTKDYLPHVRHHHHKGQVELIPENLIE